MQQSLSQGGSTVATYTWLSDGTKCAVVDNTTNGYDYLGSLIYSRSGSTRTLESAVFGGGRFVNTNNTVLPYYYITDHLGSTRVITNISGAIIEQNDYYPFGGRHANSAYAQSVSNRQKFNGKELQTTGNTNFIDYGARMYDDVIGRWSVVDPMAEKRQWVSPYNFVQNNPLAKIDPNGMLDDWVEKDGNIKWDENATSQATTKNGEKYLGKAVVVFIGSKDEKLANNGTVNGKNSKPAYVTVYGINGKDDVKTYKGLTMSSDPSKFSVLNEGWYDGTPDKMSNDRVYNYFSKNDKINGNDPRESLPYRLSVNGNTELDGTRNGQPMKMNGVFFHRIDNDGNAGMISNIRGRSEGCPVVNGANWRDIKKSLGTNIIIKVGIFRK